MSTTHPPAATPNLEASETSAALSWAVHAQRQSRASVPPASVASERQRSRPQQALLVRLMRIATTLAEQLSEEDALCALTAATDIDALAVTLERAPRSTEPVDFEMAAAYARGRAVRDALLGAEGGVTTAEELGMLLSSISRQAVDKRRRAGRLLAVQERGEWLYPRWQAAHGQVLVGLEEVLEKLAVRAQGPWDALIFFLQTETERAGETPLEALRSGRIDAARAAASVYAAQGAR